MPLNEIQNLILQSKIKEIDCHSLWLVNITAFEGYIDAIKKYLISRDIKKSEKILNEKAKNIFYLRKGITRIALSGFLDISPLELNYEYDENGKPYITNEDFKSIYFNISHSKEYLLIGASRCKSIGVDIEKVNTQQKHLLLAESVFSAEELTIYNSLDKSSQLNSFYKAWVQKEAVSKALGIGISIGFNSFSVNINPDTNEDKYILKLDTFNKAVDMEIKLEKDYIFASALV